MLPAPRRKRSVWSSQMSGRSSIVSDVPATEAWKRAGWRSEPRALTRPGPRARVERRRRCDKMAETDRLGPAASVAEIRSFRSRRVASPRRRASRCACSATSPRRRCSPCGEKCGVPVARSAGACGRHAQPRVGEAGEQLCLEVAVLARRQRREHTPRSFLRRPRVLHRPRAARRRPAAKVLNVTSVSVDDAAGGRWVGQSGGSCAQMSVTFPVSLSWVKLPAASTLNTSWPTTSSVAGPCRPPSSVSVGK
jgi:hypothetical protein